MHSASETNSLQVSLYNIWDQLSMDVIDKNKFKTVLAKIKGRFTEQSGPLQTVSRIENKVNSLGGECPVKKIKKYVQELLSLFDSIGMVSNFDLMKLTNLAFSNKSNTFVAGARKELLTRLRFPEQRGLIFLKAIDSAKIDDFFYEIAYKTLKYDGSYLEIFKDYLEQNKKIDHFIRFSICKLELNEAKTNDFIQEIKSKNYCINPAYLALKYIFSEEIALSFFSQISENKSKIILTCMIADIAQTSSMPLEIVPALVQMLSIVQSGKVLSKLQVDAPLSINEKDIFYNEENVLKEISNSISNKRACYIFNKVVDKWKHCGKIDELCQSFFYNSILALTNDQKKIIDYIIHYNQLFGDDKTSKLLDEIRSKGKIKTETFISLCKTISLTLICIEHINSPNIKEKLLFEFFDKFIKKFKKNELSFDIGLKFIEKADKTEIQGDLTAKLVHLCLQNNQVIPSSFFKSLSNKNYKSILENAFMELSDNSKNVMMFNLIFLEDTGFRYQHCIRTLTSNASLQLELIKIVEDISLQQEYLSFLCILNLNNGPYDKPYFKIINDQKVGAGMVKSLFLDNHPISNLFKDKFTKIKTVSEFINLILNYIENPHTPKALEDLFSNFSEEELSSSDFYRNYLVWLLPMIERPDYEFIIFDILKEDDKYFEDAVITSFSRFCENDYHELCDYMTSLNLYSRDLTIKIFNIINKHGKNLVKSSSDRMNEMVKSIFHSLVDEELFEEALIFLNSIEGCYKPILLSHLAIKCALKDKSLSFRILSDFNFNAQYKEESYHAERSCLAFPEELINIITKTAEYYPDHFVDNAKEIKHYELESLIEYALKFYLGSDYAREFMVRFKDKLPPSPIPNHMTYSVRLTQAKYKIPVSI